jgi:phenylacetate-CoA ligase
MDGQPLGAQQERGFAVPPEGPRKRSALGPWFVRHVTYPWLFGVLRGVSGRRIMDHVAECERRARWPLERQREAAWKRIAALMRHAFDHVPLWRAKFQSIGAEPGDIRTWEDYARLPELTRADLRDRQADIVADNVPLRARRLMKTSGTSSTPAEVWIDKARDPLHYATVHFNQRFMGFEVGERNLLLWGDRGPPRGRHTWGRRLQSRLLNRVFYGCAMLDEPILDEFHRLLVRFRPALLTVFPARLLVFVQHCRAKRLPLPPVPSIISTGETLLGEHRRLFADAFGAEVYDRYGSIELGDVAHECRAHGGMHINTHRCWVEVVPHEDVDEGHGRIVVTDLDNRSTPLLRYDVGDIGQLWPEETTDPCPCGRTLPRLAEIGGRVAEFIRGPSGRAYLRGIFWKALEAAPGILDYQVIHRRPRTLIFRCQCDSGFPEDGPDRIVRLLRERTCGEFEISVERCSTLRRTAAGKLRRLITE